MQNNPTEIELIFYPSKLKNILLVIICIFFVMLGTITILEKKDYLFRLFSILFFGVGGMVTIRELLINTSYLKIQKEGFEFLVSGKKTYIKWEDIKEFKIISVKRMNLIGWLYNSKNQKIDILRKASRKLTGVDEILPNNYGLQSNELMNIMIKYWTKDHNKS